MVDYLQRTDHPLEANMTTFTPPAVPEGMDVVAHMFATQRAIQSWFPKRQIITGVTVGNDLRFEMLMHERMRQQGSLLNPMPEPRSVFGIPIEFTENWTMGRAYTMTYQEA